MVDEAFDVAVEFLDDQIADLWVTVSISDCTLNALSIAYPFSTSLAIKNLEYFPSASVLNSPFSSRAIILLCSIVEYLIAV